MFMHNCCRRAQRTAIAPGAGVGLRCTGRVDARLRMQAQVLLAYKVGAAHSLAALASVLAFMASTDSSASSSARTSTSICSCLVSYVGAAAVAAIAAVAADTIAADKVGCIFLEVSDHRLTKTTLQG